MIVVHQVQSTFPQTDPAMGNRLGKYQWDFGALASCAESVGIFGSSICGWWHCQTASQGGKEVTFHILLSPRFVFIN